MSNHTNEEKILNDELFIEQPDRQFHINVTVLERFLTGIIVDMGYDSFNTTSLDDIKARVQLGDSITIDIENISPISISINPFDRRDMHSSANRLFRCLQDICAMRSTTILHAIALRKYGKEELLYTVDNNTCDKLYNTLDALTEYKKALEIYE